MIGERQLNPIAALIEDIPNVRQDGEVCINTGCLLEFNDSLFTEAVRLAGRKNARINVVAGPILISDQTGQSGLLTLQEEGLLKIWFRPYLEGSYYHLIETDQGDQCYRAAINREFSDPIGLRYGWHVSPDESWRSANHRSMFNNAVSVIDQYSQNVPGSERIPFLVTRPQLQQLEALAERQKPSVGLRYMEPVGLLNLDKSGLLLRSYR